MTATPTGPLRDGFALVLAMLMVVALAVLSAGMLIVAGVEARIAAAAASTLRDRAAAEADVRRVLAGWSTRRESTLALGASASFRPRPAAELIVRRLDRTLFVVSARVAAGPGRAPATAAVLVRTLDLRQVEEAAAVAAVAADTAVELDGGAVSGLDACPPGAPVAGILSPAAIGATGLRVEGAPPLDTGSPPADPFAAVPLRAIADVVPTGPAGSPRALLRGGACAPDPWNWGTARPGHPCETPVVIHSHRDLTVRGGEGFGVLIVEGDLTLTGDFVFHGYIHVRGSALLDGASVTGVLRARRVQLRAGHVRYDACFLQRALEARALDRPFRPPGRWWLPVF